jgi:hypothetical protein
MDANFLILAQQGGGGGGGATAAIFMIVYLAMIVVIIAGMWKMYTKAGQPGWAAIIPIYNAVVLLQIVGRPIWWIVLLFIPIVSFVVAIIVCNDLSKSFGRGVGTTIGLILLPFVFIPILGFGSAQYNQPAQAG